MVYYPLPELGISHHSVRLANLIQHVQRVYARNESDEFGGGQALAVAVAVAEAA